jgi:hypothetical protein
MRKYTKIKYHAFFVRVWTHAELKKFLIDAFPSAADHRVLFKWLNIRDDISSPTQLFATQMLQFF